MAREYSVVLMNPQLAQFIDAKRLYAHVVVFHNYRAQYKNGLAPNVGRMHAACMSGHAKIGETWIHSRVKNDVHRAIGFRTADQARAFAERWPTAFYEDKTRMEPCS